MSPVDGRLDGSGPSPGSRPFGFDRWFVFPCTRHELWETLARTEDYPHWWSWLRAFDADGGLAAGTTARATIRAPLPYALDLAISVDASVPAEQIEARVSGDLAGPARLALADAAEGCRTRLTWSLTLEDPVLRRLAVLGRPLMTWGHDRVVATGLRQFRDRALVSAGDGRR